MVCQLCKMTFAAKDEDSHKRRFCSMRQVHCRLGCGENFLARDTETHETNTCEMRLVHCGKGCGQTCAAKDRADHESTVSKFMWNGNRHRSAWDNPP